MVIYEVVSVVTFVYDLYLLITSDRDDNCYVFLVSMSLLFTFLFCS